MRHPRYPLRLGEFFGSRGRGDFHSFTKSHILLWCSAQAQSIPRHFSGLEGIKVYAGFGICVAVCHTQGAVLRRLAISRDSAAWAPCSAITKPLIG